MKVHCQPIFYFFLKEKLEIQIIFVKFKYDFKNFQNHSPGQTKHLRRLNSAPYHPGSTTLFNRISQETEAVANHKNEYLQQGNIPSSTPVCVQMISACLSSFLSLSTIKRTVLFCSVSKLHSTCFQVNRKKVTSTHSSQPIQVRPSPGLFPRIPYPNSHRALQY